MKNLIPSLLILSSAATASAADVTFTDLRFGAGVLSKTFKGDSSTTITSNNASLSSSSQTSSSRNADSNYRGQVQLVYGNLGPAGGLIIGVEIAVNRAKFKNTYQDAEVTTPVADLLIGYGYAVTKSLHFELTPFAGVGRAYYSVTDNGSTTTSKEWSKYLEYGARLGGYYTFDNALQIGAEVPYLVGRFDPDYNYDNAGNSVTVSDRRRTQGLGLLVSLGGRF